MDFKIESPRLSEGFHIEVEYLQGDCKKDHQFYFLSQSEWQSCFLLELLMVESHDIEIFICDV